MEPMTLAELGEPRYFERDTFTVAGIAGEYTQETTVEIPKQWARLDAVLDKMQGAPRQTYGVVYRTQPMRYVCGIDASGMETLPEGWLLQAIPAQRYAAFAGEGGLPAIRRMWPGIWMNWMPVHGAEVSDGPMVEFYPEKFGMGHDRFEIWLPMKG